MLELAPIEDSDLDLYLKIYTSVEIMSPIGGVLTKEQSTNLHSRGLSRVDKLSYKIMKGDSRLGIISAWNINVENQDILEVGWIILPEFHRQGVASRSIPLLVKEIKLNKAEISTINAFCSVKGVAANALVQKVGFSYIKSLDRTYGKITLACNWWKKDI